MGKDAWEEMKEWLKEEGMEPELISELVIIGDIEFARMILGLLKNLNRVVGKLLYVARVRDISKKTRKELIEGRVKEIENYLHAAIRNLVKDAKEKGLPKK